MERGSFGGALGKLFGRARPGDAAAPPDADQKPVEPLFPHDVPPDDAAVAEPPAAGAATPEPAAAPELPPVMEPEPEALPAPEPEPAPVVIVKPIGALANRMIQHMTAMSIAAKVPGARISRIHLPEWGVDEQEIEGVPAPQLDIGGMHANVDRIAEAMRDGRVASVSLSGYVQHVDNFLDREIYRQTFRSDIDTCVYGDDVLLINVRMAEILSALYPPYVLIPISFYQQIVRQTGLRPVFFGQLTPCPYLDDLRAAFPRAEFVGGSGAIHDFQTLRRAKNVVMSISTFSWLGCWLSDADRIIMPLTGLFNPMYGKHYARGLDLIPKNDPRYLFYLFPLNDAVPQDAYRKVHAALDGTWRPVTGAWLAGLDRRRMALPRSMEDHLEIFDEEEYLDINPDLANAKRAGHIGDGRSHYINHGFAERRLPCRIGMDYAIRHPDAGIAVSEGRFFDLIHFHAQRGRHLGYTKRPEPTPPAPADAAAT